MKGMTFMPSAGTFKKDLGATVNTNRTREGGGFESESMAPGGEIDQQVSWSSAMSPCLSF